jgi:hypothetical protein
MHPLCGMELPLAPSALDPGCTDRGAVNFSPSATTDDGSCIFCNDGSAPVGVDDGSRACVIRGCTVSAATNYNPEANVDDASCMYPHCADCTFAVSSGPCTVSDGGRCVGRSDGYGPSEECTITVGGAGGFLGSCDVFDMDMDYLIVPGGTHFGPESNSEVPGSMIMSEHREDCGLGTWLVSGDIVEWHSDSTDQGHYRGCTSTLCGLPYSNQELGGGWLICFA